MTKKYHSDVKIQKHKKHFFKKVGIFLLFALSLCLVIFLAQVFSNALTAGSFQFASISKSKIKIQEKTLYAITMGSSDDKFKALNIASSATVLGAGGYVWQENDMYYVIANIYENYTDASNVVNNMISTTFEIGIKNIVLDKVELDASSLSKEDKVLVKESLNYMYSLYVNLYNLSINVDTKAVSFIQGSSLSNTYKSECSIQKVRLQALYSNTRIAYINNMYETYVYLCDILDTLTYNLLKNAQTQLNYFVKNAEIEVVHYLSQTIDKI